MTTNLNLSSIIRDFELLHFVHPLQRHAFFLERLYRVYEVHNFIFNLKPVEILVHPSDAEKFARQLEKLIRQIAQLQEMAMSMDCDDKMDINRLEFVLEDMLEHILPFLKHLKSIAPVPQQEMADMM